MNKDSSEEDLAKIKYSILFIAVGDTAVTITILAFHHHYFIWLPAVDLAGDNWNKNELLRIILGSII